MLLLKLLAFHASHQTLACRVASQGSRAESWALQLWSSAMITGGMHMQARACSAAWLASICFST